MGRSRATRRIRPSAPRTCRPAAPTLSCACVKIDDTAPGVEEGLAAGMWTIGLAISGNEVGLPLDDWKALPAAEQARYRDTAYRRMQQSGAHYVVDTIADTLPCLDDIQRRLDRGEKP